MTQYKRLKRHLQQFKKNVLKGREYLRKERAEIFKVLEVKKSNFDLKVRIQLTIQFFGLFWVVLLCF